MLVCISIRTRRWLPTTPFALRALPSTADAAIRYSMRLALTKAAALDRISLQAGISKRVEGNRDASRVMAHRDHEYST